MCVFPEAGLVVEAFLKGDFEAVLRNQRILDLLTGGGSWAGEDVEAFLEGRVLLYLTRGPCEDRANR